MKALRSLAAALAAVVFTSTASALEPRTWIVLDGRSFEATLQTVTGSLVSLLDNTGRKIQLDKSFLSIGDNAYIAENFPDVKKGFSASQAVAMPQPAKTAKIDPKTFVASAETVSLPTTSFEVMETPHFKVMYQKPLKPQDVCELAERMWFDAAYTHSTFTQKFVNGQKFAIFLAPDDSIYEAIGGWYADLLREAGRAEDSARVAASWPQSASGNLQLPADIAKKYNIHDVARVFRAYRKDSRPNAKPELIRGVWTPFFVHCLADDMLSLQAPGTSSFGSKGFFAISAGHAYYKEVFLTGKSETSMLRAQSHTGRDVSSTRGFDDARQWAGEVKKAVRKGELQATFEFINGLTREGVDVKGNALAYAWARYLQSSLPRLIAFNKLIERIGTSRQVPDPDDFAKFYGFNTGAEMEADFQKWIQSTDFR